MAVNKEYWIHWLKAAGIRAIKTAAQTALATLPTTAVALGEIQWVIVASTAACAAILSLLTSLAGLPELKEPDVVVEGEHAKDE